MFYAGELNDENLRNFSSCSLSADVMLDEIGVCDYSAQLAPFSLPNYQSSGSQPVSLVQDAWQTVNWSLDNAIPNSAFDVTNIAQFVLRLRPRDCREFQPLPDPTPLPRRTEANAKFEPEEGTTLMLIGQNNEALGGSDDFSLPDSQGLQWNQGYLDYFASSIGAPAGITHRIDMIEGKDQFYGGGGDEYPDVFDIFAEGANDGLNVIGSWESGDRCLRCYLESSSYMIDESMFLLIIHFDYDAHQDLIDGLSDDLIEELGDFLIEFNDYPFFLQIGQRFDSGFRNADNYQLVFRTIVDALREREITNFATVMAGSASREEIWNEYYPGGDYVDWFGMLTRNTVIP